MSHSQKFARIMFTLLLSTAGLAEQGGDKTFLETASQENFAEVELAKLALKKTSSPEVRSLAGKIMRDHEVLQSNAKPFLEKSGVQAVTSLDRNNQQLWNRLNTLSGDNFDKEYVKVVDKKNERERGEFKRELSSTQDAALKQVVMSGEGVIEHDALMIPQISRSLGLDAPSQTERSAGRLIR